MSGDLLIFDRRAVRLHRERASRLDPAARFLHREVAARLVERLDEVRPRFERVLVLGCGDGEIADLLQAAGRRPALLVGHDPAPGFARRFARHQAAPAIVAEEDALPFAPASFDLVLAPLGLHWVNDLPGALLQIRQCLRPDGLLLASLWGGESLVELRAAMTRAEFAVGGGAAPRLSPLIEVRAAGALLQRAGFALPVVDGDRLSVTYPDALALMRDLRGMGETGALRLRPRHGARRALFAATAAFYADASVESDQRISATFDLITLTGWAPAPSQPKPLKRGSAVERLAAALRDDVGSARRPAG